MALFDFENRVFAEFPRLGLHLLVMKSESTQQHRSWVAKSRGGEGVCKLVDPA
jgi:hypothetical protein